LFFHDVSELTAPTNNKQFLHNPTYSSNCLYRGTNPRAIKWHGSAPKEIKVSGDFHLRLQPRLTCAFVGPVGIRKRPKGRSEPRVFFSQKKTAVESDQPSTQIAHKTRFIIVAVMWKATTNNQDNAVALEPARKQKKKNCPTQKNVRRATSRVFAIAAPSSWSI
jgi:hypothetical protein